MTTKETYQWLLTDEVVMAKRVRLPQGLAVFCRSADGRSKTLLRIEDGDIQINGERTDVGDDLQALLGIMDAAFEAAPEVAFVRKS